MQVLFRHPLPLPFRRASFSRHVSTPAQSVVDCSKVITRLDEYGGVGTFARVPIKSGEVVEKGAVCRIPVDGNKCPYVFTWSEDRSVWGHGSGASIFYNASLDGGHNTEMDRILEEDRFEIRAIKDVAVGEELTHLYKSIAWRECFTDLKALQAKIAEEGRGASPLQRVDVTSEPSLMDCSKVYVAKRADGALGVFAAAPIRNGELVERGLVRRVPVDGNVCPYVFSWCADHTVWATGSGCSPFYSPCVDGKENTELRRSIVDDKFEIYANRDIAQDEELTQVYASISWRECFKDLKAKGAGLAR